MSFRIIFLILAVLLTPLALYNIFTHPHDAIVAWIVCFFLGVGWFDFFQKESAILRDYPVLGHMRYILKKISPELHQYFIESNVNGRPFSKNMINLINTRSKNHEEFHPFGTEKNLYENGMEFLAHSMFPIKKLLVTPRVIVGSKKCKQPYSSSLLNISAMSFGALSSNAILALNHGAKEGGFSHNTGEGSLSQFHQKYAGDIVLQIGTGNFGFRNEDGTLNEESFCEKSNLEQVKMIEIKLSQGAKPGHGGVLPSVKNTVEIANIRMVKPFTDVFSPPSNPSFNSMEELAGFIQKLRELSSFKPIGIKLCIGSKDEFNALIKAFISKDILPDFITVDAAEGGTGAAPLEYSDFIGMRGDDALMFVEETLIKHAIRDEIKIIYAGKVTSGFSMYKAFCLGADICNSARGFMFSLGCIQSMKCHTDTCPTGIATQNKYLQAGLVPEVKYKRVHCYHKQTVDAFLDMMAVTGISDMNNLKKELILTS